MTSAPDQLEPPVARAALRTDTLADSVLILVVLAGVQRLVGFCRAVLFCRWLSAEQLGQWDMAFAFLVLAGPLAVLAVPGAFGRYVERYRQQRQLRAFLRKTILVCAGLTLLAVSLVYLGRGWVSLAVFGTAQHRDLVVLLAAALVAVISFNFMTELFTALRNARLVAALLFLNSVTFAALGVGLLLWWRNTAASVVVAYGGACLLSATVAAVLLRRACGDMPAGQQRLSHQALWSKLMPFAAWVWTINLAANLFEVADRYMIVHFSGADAPRALAMVGQYHSSRVVPVLLLSVALMLGSMITPHLAADWEAGRRDRVSARLRLFLKLLAFALSAAAVAALLAAPLLFGVALRGKFSAGLAVLPWTLCYCIWFGLALVAQNYLWCAEKARLCSLALLAGLIANVTLNLLLLPRLGLLGAVLATTAANVVVLALILNFNCRLGFRVDAGLWVALGLPLAVCLGPWIALLVLAAVALAAIASDRLLSPDEKRQLAEGCQQYLRRWRVLRSAWRREKGDAALFSPEDGAGTLLAATSGGWDTSPARKAPRPRSLVPLEDRGPLRVMFVITCMPVGGAETLLVQLIRRMDRRRFAPELCCLKYFGPLGEVLAEEVPAFTGLLAHKVDFRVLWRLRRLMRRRRIDAVVTVGTGGDKMFWGRLAAWLAGVPVICSSLHSTGLPDHVEWLNRRLAPITDAFIAVARPHAGYLVENEGCPADRVRVIPNGVDVENYHPRWPDRSLACELALPQGAPVVGIVAALRPEKNHELLLRCAARIRRQVPEVRFLIVGDGPRRDALEALARELSLSEAVHFLGTRSDVPEVLSLIDVLVLTSHAEANPVSILEAMATEKPVVATRVGSVPETVLDGVTGYLAAPGDEAAISARVVQLLRDPGRAAAMGRAGREHVIAHWSVQHMVEGYQDLIAGIYRAKAQRRQHRGGDELGTGTYSARSP